MISFWSHCLIQRAPKIQLQFEPFLTHSVAKCHSVGDISEIRRNFLQERVSRRRLRPVTRILKLAASFVHFQSVEGDRRRGADAQQHVASLDRDDPHANIAVDHDLLPDSPCENQHSYFSVWWSSNTEAG